MSAYEHNARLFMDEYKEEIKNLKDDLRRSQEDYFELLLEMDGMEEVIAYQDAQLPQMYDQIMHLRSQLTSAYEQRNAALERNLQQGFVVEKAKEEIANMKQKEEWYFKESAQFQQYLLSVQDQNRRLCLDLETIESDRAWERSEIDRLATALRLTENEWSKAMTTARTAEQEAADARQSNNSLLDQLQAAEAKVEYFRIKHPMVYADMEQYLPSQSAPTPQQGETVPPRPMWSRYRPNA